MSFGRYLEKENRRALPGLPTEARQAGAAAEPAPPRKARSGPRLGQASPVAEPVVAVRTTEQRQLQLVYPAGRFVDFIV